jgi:hypothetical protein
MEGANVCVGGTAWPPPSIEAVLSSLVGVYTSDATDAWPRSAKTLA